jgi:DNA polymerase I-like protein with 3'-5' exonuclease and polymerase domains
VKPNDLAAYNLLHEGTLALSAVEHHGIRIDTEYLDKAILETGKRIDVLTQEVKSDKVYKHWKRAFPNNFNLGSRSQLGHVLYKVLGYPCKEHTEKGNAKVDEAALKALNVPFVDKFLKIEELKKVKTTFLEGIKRETINGYLHPNFDLNTAISYRSNSSKVNFQQIPSRDPEYTKLIRQAFIPRKGRRIVEVDFSGIEVRIAYTLHKDPTMRKYLLDPTTDMHRDTASELFFFPVDFLIKHKDWAKKSVRDWAKNRMVFPQFYGSVYFQCAPPMWEVVADPKSLLPDGSTMLSHMRKHGIEELGDCDPKGKAGAGTFVHHVRKVEDSMWKERWPVYTQWKEKTWREYLKKGEFYSQTGFTFRGLYERNQVLNFGTQSSAFHCLLWSLIQIQKYIKRHRWKTKPIGQIHDSVLADVPEEELQDYLHLVKKVTTKDLLKHWKWIIIPMETESEVTPIEGTWYDKKQWIEEGSIWKEKGK